MASMACVLGIVLVAHVFSGFSDENVVARVRNFYGVYRVADSTPRQSRLRALYNGGVLHGAQFLDEQKRRQPLSYYGRNTGLAKAFAQLPANRPWRIGAVGLGTGTLATYGRPGDNFRIYEIDPQDWQLAARYFTYLADCAGTIDVVIGDARLSLEAELQTGKANQFDLLALDAFSGDAIPVHLLTREAFEVYLHHLRPDGIIAVHVTNRHLDLYPPMARLAEHFGLHLAWFAYRENADGELPSDWLLLSRRQLNIEGAEPSRAVPPRIRIWTDQDASLLPILR
jgi:hypothetical protein